MNLIFINRLCALFFFISLLLTCGFAFSSDLINLDKLNKIAESGDVNAQYELGLKYYLGKEVELDYIRAAKWIGKAADKGNGNAQYLLAQMYTLGLGVETDTDKIAKLYRKAASQGIVKAQFSIGFICAMESNYKEGKMWLRKAAVSGHAEAQTCFGSLYHFGKGVEIDYTEAANWYQKAAIQGERKAQYNLGLMYHNGQGVPANDIKSYAWLSIVAETGDIKKVQKYLSILKEEMAKEEITEALLEVDKLKSKIKSVQGNQK